MIRTRIMATAAALLTMLPLASVQAQSIPADVPTSVSGTYQLTYTTGNTPFAANSVKTFVINGTNETLCVDGKGLSAAFLRTVGAAEQLWQDGTVFYGLSVLPNGNLSEINVYSGSTNPNSWAGQFTGTRTSTSTTCAGGTGGSLSLSAEAEAVFALAKQLYPDLFPGATQPDLGEYEGYIYRFYQGSGIYVGVKDNEIWLMGGPFGPNPARQGLISEVKLFLDNEKIRLGLDADGTAGEGDFDLKITGTVTVAGFSTAIPEILIENIAAPSSTDLDDIEDLIREEFEEVGTVSQLTIVEVNNTANRITFDLEFKGSVTAQGFTIVSDYKLRYDYTK